MHPVFALVALTLSVAAANKPPTLVIHPKPGAAAPAAAPAAAGAAAGTVGAAPAPAGAVGAQPATTDPPSAEVLRVNSVKMPAAPRQPQKGLAPLAEAVARREQIAATAPALSDTDRIMIEIYNAVHRKNWLLLLALLVSLLIQGIKKGGQMFIPVFPKFWAWVNTDRGGVTLTLASGLLSAICATLLIGGHWTLQLVMDAVHYGVVYAGGYVTVKKLFFPSGADRADQCRQLGDKTGEDVGTGASASASAAADAINAVGKAGPPR